jgi:acyl carrier protein
MTDRNGNGIESKDGGHNPSAAEILQAWILVRLSAELQVAPAEIDVREPLTSYGLDSVVAFTLTGELADRLGRELPATLLWDFPTLEELATHLAKEIEDENVTEALLAELDRALTRTNET